jgi:hypothetical protein
MTRREQVEFHNAAVNGFAKFAARVLVLKLASPPPEISLPFERETVLDFTTTFMALGIAALLTG